MPFSAPEQASPKPEKKPGKKPGRKKTAMEKLASLPGALALSGAMGLCTQAGCGAGAFQGDWGLHLPPEGLPPSAVDIGKTRKEISERKGQCNDGAYEAREILNDPWRFAAHPLAAEAEEKFRICFYALDKQGLWDEKKFREAQTALDLARKTK